MWTLITACEFEISGKKIVYRLNGSLLAEYKIPIIKEKWKSLLLLNNRHCHADVKLSNIKYNFFRETAAVMAPMDQWVIKII